MLTFSKWGSVVAAAVFVSTLYIADRGDVAVEPALAKNASSNRSVDAFRKGVAAYEKGDKDSAVEFFNYASGEGILGAQLYLARMYSRGDLVENDEGKAYEQYMRIIRGFRDLGPSHAGAKYVAEAYSAIGRFYEKGVPSRAIPRDVNKAAQYYRHAAVYFGDSRAKFKLARLYLKDSGLERNMPVAAKWLHSAAKKDHAPSQALLGELLWAGGPVERRAIQALALVELARLNAKGAERGWINDLHAKLFSEAKDEEKAKARKIIDDWKSRFEDKEENIHQPGPQGRVDVIADSRAWSSHPDPVSVIFGATEGSDGFDPDAIFGAATQIFVPDLDGVNEAVLTNNGASGY